MTYILSIETDAGTYRHGFHLGTDLAVARSLAEDFFRNGTPKIGRHVRTVALIREREFLCFDGRWSDAPREDEEFASVTVDWLRRRLGMKRKVGAAAALPGWSYCGARIDRLDFARGGIVRFYGGENSTHLATFQGVAALDRAVAP